MRLRSYRHLQEDNMHNNRYSRQVQLPEIGTSGQELLQQAKVLIIGVGGLGCPAAQYLAAAGIGTIGLVDQDRVEATNLHRQILFGAEDIGSFKAEVAKKELSRLNDEPEIHVYNLHLSSLNAPELFDGYDVIVDCTDNFPTKYLINDTCLQTNKPWVYASIFKFEGQLSVFNYQQGPTYRCLFPSVPRNNLNCEETGVIGVLPGILGTYQASEVLKIILGIGEVLSGKLKIVHTLTMKEQTISFKRVAPSMEQPSQQGIASEQAHCTFSDNNIYLDVREPYEQPQPDTPNIIRIPLRELKKRHHELPREIAIHVYCQSGVRSKQAIELLASQGHQNLINVEGGIQSLLK